MIVAEDRQNEIVGRPAVSVPEPGPCPFCPGSEHLNPVEIARVGDDRRWRIRVTPDKHPLLRVEGELDQRGAGMSDVMQAIGAHELVTDTPDHERHWADFSREEMEELLQVYRARSLDLRRDPRFRFVLVLKNRAAAWSRYRHAHSHVIATPFVPRRIDDELAGAEAYFRRRERCVFCDQIRQTISDGSRLIAERSGFAAFAPFASEYPYEVWISPVDHAADFGSLPDAGLAPLAHLLIDVLARLRRVCDDPAYSIALHSGAVDGRDAQRYHWHWEIVPQLGHALGMEWATGIFANPVAPERAAEELRSALVGTIG